MLVVKKFGGSSVANKERIYNVANRCIEDYKAGHDVVVVLSAMGKTTNELIAKAKDINPKPPKRELDMLVTVGEQISVSLMCMAMAELGVPAVSLNAFQVAMHTTSDYTNARLTSNDVLQAPFADQFDGGPEGAEFLQMRHVDAVVIRIALESSPIEGLKRLVFWP